LFRVSELRSIPGLMKEKIGQLILARHRLTNCNLRLAASIAAQFGWSHLPSQDLLQLANIGLIDAVDRWDYKRGFKFSTYATHWIRQALFRGIGNTENIIRAPVHVMSRFAAYKAQERRAPLEVSMSESHAFQARVKECSRVAELKPAVAMLMLFQSESDPLELEEIDGIIGGDDVENTEKADDILLKNFVVSLLERLDEKPQEIIRRRFGLFDENEESQTLEEIGEVFGVTRERIRQIEKKAMKKLYLLASRRMSSDVIGA
jgi:RNA polymerase primary sigma factor